VAGVLSAYLNPKDIKMLPIRTSMPARTTFPNATVSSALPPEVLQHLLSKARLAPADLISLATSCQGLWEKYGDASLITSYMLKVHDTFPQFAPADQIEVPAALYKLLYSLHDKLPVELLSHFGDTIQGLTRSTHLDIPSRLSATSKAALVCAQMGASLSTSESGLASPAYLELYRRASALINQRSELGNDLQANGRISNALQGLHLEMRANAI
jgi:hypothetical protein